MRVLKHSIVSFISHARDGFNKIYKYKIPDRAKNKWLASHTSRPNNIDDESKLFLLFYICPVLIFYVLYNSLS